MPERIETERLVLRHWTDADREPFAALNADPEVMTYLFGPRTREQSDAGVDRIERTIAEHGFGLWALQVKDGGFIGFTGLQSVHADLPVRGRVEVGWRLAREAWGHGYATEAARAAVAYGFDTARLTEIVALAAAGNTRSRKVMERIGMRYDPASDFDHPMVSEGSPLRPHVVYRLAR